MKLAGNGLKHMEGNRRFWCLLWKVPEGDRNGRKRREGTRIVQKNLVSTGTYVTRCDVMGVRKSWQSGSKKYLSPDGPKQSITHNKSTTNIAEKANKAEKAKEDKEVRVHSGVGDRDA